MKIVAGKPSARENQKKCVREIKEVLRCVVLWRQKRNYRRNCQDEDDETSVLPTVAVIKLLWFKDQRTLLSIPGNQLPGKHNKTRGFIARASLAKGFCFFQNTDFSRNCSFSLHDANHQRCLRVRRDWSKILKEHDVSLHRIQMTNTWMSPVYIR